MKHTLVIACGALAREIIDLCRHYGWSQIKVQCLPAELHNRPEQIPDAVERVIEKAQGHYSPIFVAYGDCGTGGQLDRMLQKYDIERLPGSHCYEFFAGHARFAQLSEEELGSFYLTDFLARHFHRLIVKGLKLDVHPELKSMIFEHYRRVVYLPQRDDPNLHKHAQAAAAWLDLPLLTEPCSYGLMQNHLQRIAIRVEQPHG